MAATTLRSVGRRAASVRTAFRQWTSIRPLFSHLDLYGHINQDHYHAYINLAINDHLHSSGFSAHRGNEKEAGYAISLTKESGCTFHSPLNWPSVDAGVAVSRIGTSSVRYEVGLFMPGRDRASADGHMTHVWVDAATHTPVRIPAYILDVLVPLELRPLAKDDVPTDDEGF